MDYHTKLEETIKRVRCRPNMVLCEHDDELVTDVFGSFLRKFMRLFVIEFYFSGCRKFEFVKKTDNSFEFKADSTNCWADAKNDANAWQNIFCHAYKESRLLLNLYSQKEITIDDIVYDKDVVGIGYLAVAQILSEYFNITVIKDNKQTIASFADGVFIESKEEYFDIKNNQTIINFKFDETIFLKYFSNSNVNISIDDFCKIAQSMAFFFSGAQISVFYEAENGTNKINYKYDNLSDYAMQRFNCNDVLCFEFNACSDENDKIQSKGVIKVVMIPCEGNGQTEVYCNYRKLEYGKPFDAVRDVLIKLNRNYNVLITIFQTYPMWTNASKRGIENLYIYKSIYNQIAQSLK